MKPPTITLGKWKIKYIQVPYDNCYFVFENGNCNHYTRLPRNSSKILHYIFEGIINEGSNPKEVENRRNRVEKFFDRVKMKDEYLDRD